MIRVVPVAIQKLDDDSMGVLRISAGGFPEKHFYLRYRGDEDLIEKILDLLAYEFINGKPSPAMVIRPFRPHEIIKGDPGDLSDILRISAGGKFGEGFYLLYQGDQSDIEQLLTILATSFDKYLKKRNA